MCARWIAGPPAAEPRLRGARPRAGSATPRSSPSEGGIVETWIVRRGTALAVRAAAHHAARRASRSFRRTTRSSAGRPDRSSRPARSRRIRPTRVRSSDSRCASARCSPRDGVLGRFGVDFVSVPRADGWRHFAIEINLRKGGTTHTFQMLQFLTGGRYDAGRAEFVTPAGETRRYLRDRQRREPVVPPARPRGPRRGRPPARPAFRPGGPSAACLRAGWRARRVRQDRHRRRSTGTSRSRSALSRSAVAGAGRRKRRGTEPPA